MTSISIKKNLNLLLLTCIAFSTHGNAQFEDDRLDSTFQTGIVSRINTNEITSVDAIVVQADEKIIIGGNFQTIDNMPRAFIARLEIDGSIDLEFNPAISESVTSLALQNDGKILVGGVFQIVNSEPRSGIARLNSDGSLDQTFNANLDVPDTKSISVLDDGKIIITGDFNSIGGTNIRCVARLNPNGDLDPTFAGINDLGFCVHAAPLSNDKILVGGTIFVSNRYHLFRLNEDGTLDPDFDANLPLFGSNVVNEFEILENGSILVAGNLFLNTPQARDLALLDPDGFLDENFNLDISGEINDIVQISGDTFILGGRFQQSSEQDFSYLARLNSNGTLDTSFNPSLNDEVRVVVDIDEGQLLVSGLFSAPEEVRRVSRIARFGAIIVPPQPNEELCVPIQSKTGNVSVICL